MDFTHISVGTRNLHKFTPCGTTDIFDYVSVVGLLSAVMDPSVSPPLDRWGQAGQVKHHHSPVFITAWGWEHRGEKITLSN